MTNYRPRKSKVGRTFNGNLTLDRLYDARWKAYRVRFLAENGRCYRCGFKATVVDHLVPHKGNVKLFEMLDNHVPLCKPCHDRITALYDKSYVIGASVAPKVQDLVSSREARGLTFRVKVLAYYSLDRPAPDVI